MITRRIIEQGIPIEEGDNSSTSSGLGTHLLFLELKGIPEIAKVVVGSRLSQEVEKNKKTED
jgi:hypothetical protein